MGIQAMVCPRCLIRVSFEQRKYVTSWHAGVKNQNVFDTMDSSLKSLGLSWNHMLPCYGTLVEDHGYSVEGVLS